MEVRCTTNLPMVFGAKNRHGDHPGILMRGVSGLTSAHSLIVTNLQGRSQIKLGNRFVFVPNPWSLTFKTSNGIFIHWEFRKPKMPPWFHKKNLLVPYLFLGKHCRRIAWKIETQKRFQFGHQGSYCGVQQLVQNLCTSNHSAGGCHLDKPIDMPCNNSSKIAWKKNLGCIVWWLKLFLGNPQCNGVAQIE